METKNLQHESGANTGELMNKDQLIKVRAVMSCPSCSFKKSFKNQFHRSDIEMMVVSLKVFDWMACTRCGDLLNLDLEFQI
jgi:hypothetical protein